MALRDRLAGWTQPFLEPGEQIQQVFRARSGPNPNLAFLTWLIYFFTTYEIVAVTDRAVVVLEGGRLTTKPRRVFDRLPRQTRLGPPSGVLWSRLPFPGRKKHWVHRRFYRDVEAADNAAAA